MPLKWVLVMIVVFEVFASGDATLCFQPNFRQLLSFPAKIPAAYSIQSTESDKKFPVDDFLLLTVATKATSAFKKFQRSTEIYGLPLKVLGMGQKWPGLGLKILLIKEELENHLKTPNKIVMFADAYDVLFNAGAQQILDKFEKFNARVLFSAEHNCSPNRSLCSLYPQVKEGKRFINSGLFIGFVPELYKIVTHVHYELEKDDQEYFTRIYLDENLRRNLNIKLDHRSEIFLTLEGAYNNVEIRFEGKEPYIYNRDFGTLPMVVHTPGLCKYQIDIVGNYIPKIWKTEGGCAACLEDNVDLSHLEIKEYPIVVIAVFVDETHSLPAFLAKLHDMDYPRERVHLFIYNEVKTQAKLLRAFVKKFGNEYSSVKLVHQWKDDHQLSPKDAGIDVCVSKNCDFYFNVDSVVHLDDPKTLRLLIEQNRPVVAPMLFGSEKGQRNFRGIVKYCSDNIDIIKESDRGLWKMDVVTSCYLIRSDVIRNPETKPVYGNENEDPDVVFSQVMGGNDVELLVSNRHNFGHLEF